MSVANLSVEMCHACFSVTVWRCVMSVAQSQGGDVYHVYRFKDGGVCRLLPSVKVEMYITFTGLRLGCVPSVAQCQVGDVYHVYRFQDGGVCCLLPSLKVEMYITFTGFKMDVFAVCCPVSRWRCISRLPV